MPKEKPQPSGAALIEAIFKAAGMQVHFVDCTGRHHGKVKGWEAKKKHPKTHGKNTIRHRRRG